MAWSIMAHRKLILGLRMKKSHLIALAVLLLGSMVAFIIVKTAPKPQKKPLEPVIPLVEVTKPSLTMVAPTWTTGASMNASQNVSLVAQVSGQVDYVSEQAYPGAFVGKGAVLAQLDSRQFELVVEQKRAAYVQAKANLDIEKGQVQKALADYRLSGMQLKKEAKALALREPQLASAQAALTMAKADLDKAKLDLARTRIEMPFDGYVLNHHVAKGAYVNTSATAFTVIEADQFWAHIKVPQSFLEMMGEASKVRFQQQPDGEYREGRMLSVLPQVDAGDRQARVLVALENPLSETATFPVRYNDYLYVSLVAESLNDVYQVPLESVEKGRLWVVNEGLKLSHRPVEVVYRGREHAWIRVPLSEGDRFLQTHIEGALEGQLVRVQGEEVVSSPVSAQE